MWWLRWRWRLCSHHATRITADYSLWCRKVGDRSIVGAQAPQQFLSATTVTAYVKSGWECLQWSRGWTANRATVVPDLACSWLLLRAGPFASCIRAALFMRADWLGANYAKLRVFSIPVT